MKKLIALLFCLIASPVFAQIQTGGNISIYSPPPVVNLNLSNPGPIADPSESGIPNLIYGTNTHFQTIVIDPYNVPQLTPPSGSIQFVDGAPGILGMTNGVPASPGYVGETGYTRQDGYSQASGTEFQCGQQLLQPGNYVVFGSVVYSPSASNAITQATVAISSDPSSIPDYSYGQTTYSSATQTFSDSTNFVSYQTPNLISISIPSPTEYYITCSITYTGAAFPYDGKFTFLRVQ